MTTPQLRVVRRSRAPLTASITAAVAQVTDTAKIFGTSTGQRVTWQDEAWRFTKVIGELGYFVRWRSNACAQVRLIASEVDADTGIPTGSIDPDDADGQLVVELVKQIAGGPLGQKRLIKRAAACLTVPGELWICILQRPDGERWYAVSKREIRQSDKYVELPTGGRGPTVAIQLPDGQTHDYSPTEDAMFRVWNESFDDATEPDSPVRAVLDPLAEIERATKKIRNADRSRLLNNGLLMVPSEASLPDTMDTATNPATRRVAASLQRMLVQAAEVSDRDESSMAAVLPIVGAAPGEHLGKIAHIEFSKEATKTAVEIRTDAISRLAMGLDMTPERLLGMGSNSNHWSAYLLADDDVKNHVNPVMEVLCQAIYDATMVQILTANGIDPNRYTLWFDSSRLTADPDLTDEAKDAYAKRAITARALVTHLGLPEDALYDWTTVEGLAEWARDRISEDPNLIGTLAAMVPELDGYDFSPPPNPFDQQDEPQDQTDQPDEQPGQQEPDTENDQPTEPAYSAIEDLFVNRALELAAKRRIHTNDRQTHARLRHVPIHERNRHLPPATPQQAATLIKGWDNILTSDYAQAQGLNADRIRTAVHQRATAELTGRNTNAHTMNATNDGTNRGVSR